MNDVWDLLRQGGPVMVPLVVLSVILYQSCLQLLLFLTRLHRRLLRPGILGRTSVGRLRALQTDVAERFAHDEIVIVTLVAAAPLLGLLGTVMGMVGTFDAMSSQSGLGSSAGLAEGISMALITTETGLAVAIPAVILMYYAQRQHQRVIGRLLALEQRTGEAA